MRMTKAEPFDVTQINEEPLESQPGGLTYIDDLKRLASDSVAQQRDILNERQQTHGDFRSNARLSQKLKQIFRSTETWEHLDDVEKESMDMIALKFSRILSGKSLSKEHWEDVVGYARLAERECD